MNKIINNNLDNIELHKEGEGEEEEEEEEIITVYDVAKDKRYKNHIAAERQINSKISKYMNYTILLSCAIKKGKDIIVSEIYDKYVDPQNVKFSFNNYKSPIDRFIEYNNYKK
jgi:hypothetical protein